MSAIPMKLYRSIILAMLALASMVSAFSQIDGVRDADDVSFLQQSLAMEQHGADHLADATSRQADFDVSSPERVPAADRLLQIVDPDSQYYTDSSMDIQHVSKCGGTFVGHVANASLRSFDYGRWKGTNELSTFTPAPAVFSIGLIRNPFDFLLSYWSFNAPHWETGEFPLYLHSLDVRKTPPLPAGTTQADRTRFHKWVHHVSDEKFGFMSLNFYGKYLKNDTVYPGDDWHKLNARHFFAKYPRSPAQETLADDPLPPIDCWVRTESLEDDTRSCFRLYEEFAGPGSVDWVAFNGSLETAEHNEAAGGTGHVSCYQMFDDELAAFVNASEYSVLRKFNYSRCQPH